MHSSSNLSEYDIERLDEDNINDLGLLYKAVYNKAVDKDHFQKKYETAYTGVTYIGFIAYTKQKMPVAYYGVIPCRITNNNSIILAAQSTDTMTDPQHQKKGLFVELARRCYELCRSKGILFVFGFPNQNSLPGFVNNLDWKMTETMDCFIIPVKTFPVERLSIKFAFLHPLYKKYKKLLLKKYVTQHQGIASSAVSEGYGGVYRDEEYLHYRTYSATHVIQVSGSLIWIRINNGLIIGDMKLAADDFEAVITKTVKLARRLGIKQVQFQCCRDTELHRLFAKRFESIPSFHVGFKDLGSEIDFNKLKFTYADIDIF